VLMLQHPMPSHSPWGSHFMISSSAQTTEQLPIKASVSPTNSEALTPQPTTKSDVPDEAQMAKGLPGASQWMDLSRTPGAVFTKYPMLVIR